MVDGMDKRNTTEIKVICESCIMAKQHQMPCPQGLSTNASEPMEIVPTYVSNRREMLQILTLTQRSWTIRRAPKSLESPKAPSRKHGHYRRRRG